MDDTQKAILRGELQGIRTTILASGGLAAGLSQTTFPVTGPVVNIATFPIVAQAMRQQADAMDRLANLVEKVINAS